jgi:putative flippase GtrA
MSSLIGRAAACRRSPHFKRILKFGAVSVISTVIAQTVLLLTFDVGHIASAMVCNVIATAVATVPAYWLNRTWTWGKRGKSHLWREVAPFWIIAFIGLVLSTVAVGVAAHNANRLSSSQEVKDLFVHCANFITYGIIWVARYSIFNKFMFGPQTTVPVAKGGAIDAMLVAETAPSPAPPPAVPAPAPAGPNGRMDQRVG